jgi:hypothetical protein
MPRWPGREGRYGKPKRARRRKSDTAKADLEPSSCVTPGGQGVHREVESEGHEEKYRAVIDGGDPEDEPVGQRWGKVEPALWRRRRTHSPTAPRCMRTARYGRAACDLRRTGAVSGWHRGKQAYKRERSGKRCCASSRTTARYLKHGESRVTEKSAAEWAGEGGRRRWVGRSRKPESKGEEEDQFHE